MEMNADILWAGDTNCTLFCVKMLFNYLIDPFFISRVDRWLRQRFANYYLDKCDGNIKEQYNYLIRASFRTRSAAISLDSL